jgi:hypothetical protein
VRSCKLQIDFIKPVKNKNNMSCVHTYSVPPTKHSPPHLQNQSHISV